MAVTWFCGIVLVVGASAEQACDAAVFASKIQAIQRCVEWAAESGATIQKVNVECAPTTGEYMSTAQHFAFANIADYCPRMRWLALWSYT